jgi:hypothetical protein
MTIYKTKQKQVGKNAHQKITWEICEFKSIGVIDGHWKGEGISFKHAQLDAFDNFWELARRHNFSQSNSTYHICIYENGGLTRFLQVICWGGNLKVRLDDTYGLGDKIRLEDRRQNRIVA